MKVYGLWSVDSDGCTYSCDVLHAVYAKKEDAETELTRLELIGLEGDDRLAKMGHPDYYKWYSALSNKEQIAANHKELYVKEIEVIE